MPLGWLGGDPLVVDQALQVVSIGGEGKGDVCSITVFSQEGESDGSLEVGGFVVDALKERLNHRWGEVMD